MQADDHGLPAMRDFLPYPAEKMRVSALPELQAYPPSFSPPPKAAMEAREFIRVSLHRTGTLHPRQGRLRRGERTLQAVISRS